MCFVASQMQLTSVVQGKRRAELARALLSRSPHSRLHPKMQVQSYKKSTHPARDEWRKNCLLRFLTFGFLPTEVLIGFYLQGRKIGISDFSYATVFF